MNTFEFLTRQHQIIVALFPEILAEKDKGRRRTKVHDLARILTAHLQLEEKLLYPLAAKTLAAIVVQSYEEHALAKVALAHLVKTPPTDRRFLARVRVLESVFVAHVEEEERVLLPRLESKMDAKAAMALGVALERRAKALAKGGSRGTPRARAAAPRRRRTRAARRARLLARPTSPSRRAARQTRKVSASRSRRQAPAPRGAPSTSGAEPEPERLPRRGESTDRHS